MNKSNRQTGGRKPLRPEFFLPHFPALHFAALNLARDVYGVAATSCCRSRSSSNSKSEYIS
jgi:hypothetical protein